MNAPADPLNDAKPDDDGPATDQLEFGAAIEKKTQRVYQSIAATNERTERALQELEKKLTQINQAVASVKSMMHAEAQFGHTTRGQIAKWDKFRTEMIAQIEGMREFRQAMHDNEVAEAGKLWKEHNAGRMQLAELTDQMAELTKAVRKLGPPALTDEEKKAQTKARRSATRSANVARQKREQEAEQQREQRAAQIEQLRTEIDNLEAADQAGQ